MMAGYILRVIIRITSLNASSIMLLIAPTPSSLLRFPFLLYASRWTPTYEETFLAARVFFTSSTMSTTYFRSFADNWLAYGKRSLLSASVEFLTGPGNCAVSVLSCADPRPTVVVWIRLLTMSHVCTSVLNNIVSTTVAMFWAGHARRSVILVSSEAGVGWSLDARGVDTCVVHFIVSCSCCLSVCHPTATAVTFGSWVVGTREAVVAGVHVGGILANTILQSSLVISCICICSFAFSC